MLIINSAVGRWCAKKIDFVQWLPDFEEDRRRRMAALKYEFEFCRSAGRKRDHRNFRKTQVWHRYFSTD